MQNFWGRVLVSVCPLQLDSQTKLIKHEYKWPHNNLASDLLPGTEQLSDDTDMTASCKCVCDNKFCSATYQRVFQNVIKPVINVHESSYTHVSHRLPLICSMSHLYVTICTQKNSIRDNLTLCLYVWHIFLTGYSAQGLALSFNNSKVSLLLGHHFNSNRSQRNVSKS